MRYVGNFLFFAAILLAIVLFTWFSVWIMDSLDEGAEIVYQREKPHRIERCKERGVVFERETKYDDKYGCMEKTNGEWKEVK